MLQAQHQARNAAGGGQLLLRKLAPLANDLDGIFAVGEAIGDRKRDKDLAAGGKLAARGRSAPRRRRLPRPPRRARGAGHSPCWELSPWGFDRFWRRANS
jgi:hypothetical protein